MIERIGKRIAQHRQDHELTQEVLAAKLGISRVAISHIELDISVPGERTIALLAGVFKCTPYELVQGTTYPQAKADRLPTHVAMYTQLELDLALLSNDLDWLGCLEETPARLRLVDEIQRKWSARLDVLALEWLDPPDRALIRSGRQALAEACHF
jgi:transcriptional regulator with XRE-family HTH domain